MSVGRGRSSAEDLDAFDQPLERREGIDVVQVVGRLPEDVEPARLEASWRRTVDRHPGLRFALRPGGGAGPLPEADREVLAHVDFEDWSDHAPEVRASLMDAWLEEDRRLGFDLHRPPLFRLRLLRLGRSDHRLVLSFHRMLLDTRSVATVLRDLLSDGEMAAAQPGPDPATGASSRDPAEGKAAAEAHWREALVGFRTPTALPIIRVPDGASGTARRVEHAARLSAEATRDLKAQAAGHGVSLEALLRGAWGLLLHAYSGDSDVVFGVRAPVDPRPGAGAPERPVGNRSHTFPVRVRLAESDPMGGWLQRLQAEDEAARPFQKVAPGQVRQWSELPPASPLFRTLLVLEGPQLNARLRELGPEWRDRDFRVTERASAPITIYGHPERELALRVVSDGARVDDADSAQLLQHFARLLENIARAPRALLGELSVVGDAERTELATGQVTTAEIPRALVVDLFEEQAARTPDRPAVSHGEASWSYRELSDRVSRLAGYLRGRGIGPGARVGLMMEPSLDMVSGLLGVMKAGAAYVPLDPAFPEKRLEFMAQDAGLSMLLTLERFRSVPLVRAAEAVSLDSEWSRIEGEARSEAPFVAAPGGDSDAYVLYTSGSTGNPKGVQVTQRALVNLLWSMRSRPGISKDDVFLALTTISFDIAGVELMLPLIAGARVALVDRPVATDALALRDAIEEIRPTILQATPSLWRMLLEAGWEGNANCTIISGGEALDRSLADRLRARCASLWNGYGPTETTIYSTIHEVEAGVGPVPIGRPVANTRVYVLDSRLRLRPRGLPGELAIGGVGVARGYLNRPELTREKFLPNPFVEGDERLYRTGDLARFLADGTLEYLGRADHQVKIRGVRIELGEIDLALSRHPAVRQAVVVAREAGVDSRRLVAYLVVDRAREPRVDELRAFLAQTLPEAMIPSAFVLMDAFPLTPNGKVDRLALPAPGSERPELAAGFSEPVADDERRLAGIWESVLHVRPIGAHDNFFDLGGDSLLALRLFTRIERLTGHRLPLATLLAAPTVATLAPYLSGGGAVSWKALVTIQPGGDRPPVFCVPGIGGNAVGYYALARHLGPDQPVFGLQTPGLDGRTQPFTRIEDLAAHYVQEVRAAGASGPFHLVGASFGGLVAFEMARQLELAGEDVGLVALLDSYAPGYASAGIEGSAMPQAMRGYVARIRFHLHSLLAKPGRLGHLRGMARTLLRRTRSRAWQIAYRLHEGTMTRLPPYMRNVREAGYLASRRYAPAPAPLAIAMFRARDRAVDDPGDPRLGWGGIARGGVEVVPVPGNHLSMLIEPHIRVLAAELRQRLDGATKAARENRGTAG